MAYLSDPHHQLDICDEETFEDSMPKENRVKIPSNPLTKARLSQRTQSSRVETGFTAAHVAQDPSVPTTQSGAHSEGV